MLAAGIVRGPFAANGLCCGYRGNGADQVNGSVRQPAAVNYHEVMVVLGGWPGMVSSQQFVSTVTCEGPFFVIGAVP